MCVCENSECMCERKREREKVKVVFNTLSSVTVLSGREGERVSVCSLAFQSQCVCVYVCIHACVFIHMCMCVHAFVYTCMNACVCIHACMYLHACNSYTNVEGVGFVLVSQCTSDFSCDVIAFL